MPRNNQKRTVSETKNRMQLMAASTDAAKATDMSGRIRGGEVTYEKLPSFDSNNLSRSTSE